MKKLFFLPFLLLAITTNAQQVDPYHKATGGFGYPVSSTPSATLWWAEGTYKIMQDMPSPSGKPAKVSIFSARNEWESFQLVIVPGWSVLTWRIFTFSDATGRRWTSGSALIPYIPTPSLTMSN